MKSIVIAGERCRTVERFRELLEKACSHIDFRDLQSEIVSLCVDGVIDDWFDDLRKSGKPETGCSLPEIMDCDGHRSILQKLSESLGTHIVSEAIDVNFDDYAELTAIKKSGDYVVCEFNVKKSIYDTLLIDYGNDRMFMDNQQRECAIKEMFDETRIYRSIAFLSLKKTGPQAIRFRPRFPYNCYFPGLTFLRHGDTIINDWNCWVRQKMK